MSAVGAVSGGGGAVGSGAVRCVVVRCDAVSGAVRWGEVSGDRCIKRWCREWCRGSAVVRSIENFELTSRGMCGVSRGKRQRQKIAAAVWRDAYVTAPLLSDTCSSSSPFIATRTRYVGNHCVRSTDQGAFPAAIAAAKAAEQIVVFVGMDHSIETEGTDRQTLILPGMRRLTD